MKKRDLDRLKQSRRRRMFKGQSGQRYNADLIKTHREPPSSRWQPMVHIPENDSIHPQYDRPSEWWENWRYYANVTRFESGFFLADSEWAVLGVSSIDETARHDWRDFQRIKNDIVGDEWEAVELYPAESRLVDPSNRFYLWCVPPGILRFGYRHGRRVYDLSEAKAPQRPFPKGAMT